MGLYFKDFKLDPGDHAFPKKIAPREIFTNYIPQSKKNIDVFFKTNLIVTDDDFFFDIKRNENFHNFDSLRVLFF